MATFTVTDGVGTTEVTYGPCRNDCCVWFTSTQPDGHTSAACVPEIILESLARAVCDSGTGEVRAALQKLWKETS